VKPIAIPDRWDDVTPIPGYAGEGSGKGQRPNWTNDNKFEEEAFTDLNGNGIWDPGEPYVDGNANGMHDAEAYDPLTTGYVADPTAGNALAPAGDFGREITLHLASPGDTPVPGQFQSVDFPPTNKGTPITGSGAYASNWASCNAALIEPGDHVQVEPGRMVTATDLAMRNLIAQDPNAAWDPVTQTVKSSAFALSPRVIFVMAYDPRLALSGFGSTLGVPKLIPAFMEQMVGSASVLVRFVRVSTSGGACAGASAGGFFYACATPATHASWGQVKATYR
jgi:hypothetical protein